MKAYIVILLVLAYFGQSEAVRCWTCNEKSIFDCNILEDQEECSGKCMKSVIGDLVTRSCSSLCLEANSGGQGMFCCNSFLCNTATTTSSSFVFVLAASVITLLYNRM